ncbi:MAG: hypothetical protein ACJAZJ_001045 [Candidatus Endobugula sp.]
MIHQQYTITLSSAAKIAIKTLQKIDQLIPVLSETVRAYLTKPNSASAFVPALSKNCKEILAIHDQYMAYAGNNHLSLLYKNQGSTLLQVIKI